MRVDFSFGSVRMYVLIPSKTMDLRRIRNVLASLYDTNFTSMRLLRNGIVFQVNRTTKCEGKYEQKVSYC